uniref:Retinol dehydrogenase 11 n=1 Tax=Pan paniscus TaxID=9597 RepID=A0A2R9BEK6_PANPA
MVELMFPLLLLLLPFLLYMAAPQIRSSSIFSLPGCGKGGIGGQRDPDHNREPAGVGAETGPV